MQSPARATRLTCEYLVDPIGIEAARPRLSWQMADDRRGARQTAYQIVAGSTPDTFDAWDSGKVKAELEKRGLNARVDTGGRGDIHTSPYKSYHTTTPNGFDLQISATNRSSRTPTA